MPPLTVPSRRRRAVAGAVGFALAVVLGVAAVLLVRNSPAQRPAPASAAATHTVRTAIATGRLLFVGASYTVGLGATDPGATYPTLVARRLDRRFSVAAASGTGFVSPGPRHQGTYAQRIAALPAGLDPRIVVIQGGRNDLSYPVATVHSAARATIALVHHRFARAQVVVMGPIPALVPVSARMLVIRDTVRQAAVESGAGFIDPIAEHWITLANEKRFAGPVPFHPNDAGYAYIATRLVSDLPAALDRAAGPTGADTPVPGAPGTDVAGVPATAASTASPVSGAPDVAAPAGSARPTPSTGSA